jgi:hypothetical protein
MTISTRCRTLAEQAKASASSMHCRSNAEAKAAALKAAAVYKMIAGWADSMEGAALADRCMAAADDYLRSAKPYAKRAVSTERAAYVKGAAVLREMAEVARRAEEDEVSAAILRACDAVADHEQAMAITSIDAEAVETMTYTSDETVQATPRRSQRMTWQRYTRKTPDQES